MEFSEVVRKRHMVRRYDPDRPVPAEVINTALRNAIRAPSAGFSQGWDFVVLTKPEERQAYWAATTDPDDEPDSWLAGIKSAPALILCLSDDGTYLRRYAEPDKGWADMDEARWPVPYWDIDTGMAALMILLTAVDQGLGGLLLRDASRGARRRLRGVRHPLMTATSSAWCRWAIRCRMPRAAASRRGLRGLDQVAHYGRFGRHPPERSRPDWFGHPFWLFFLRISLHRCPRGL